MSTQRRVVIVDAYAPTRRLAPEFVKAGFEVVRVQSTPEPPVVYRAPFDLSPYIANVVHLGDLDATARALSAYAPVAVLPGGEMGVELADRLSEAMGLATNGTALSPARRDKYLQMEAVRAAGLRATRQILVADAGHLAAWHAEVGGTVVVKPVRSAAGDGVSFCDTPEEAVAAYHRILGAENVFSVRNEAVIAQEYLAGGEYIVDTVSREGRHYVSDIWKYDKLTANGVRDLMAGIRLLPRRGEAQDRVVPYALEVLDALGIQIGAAHIEIKLTPDGPCLVELGARMPGVDLPFHSQECMGGEGQLQWIVDAYARPERFDDRWKDDYKLTHYFGQAWSVATEEGTVAGYPLLAAAEALPAHYDTKVVVQPGERLRRTVDDMTCPVIVCYRHPVEEYVLRDCATFRQLDGPGFYELAES